MKSLVFGLVAAVSLVPLACSSRVAPTDDFGYEGTGIAVSVAALDLQGVADACYSFEIQNQAKQRVVARGSAQNRDGGGVAGQNGDGGPEGLSGRESSPLCSSRFGDSGGAISYVAPCDASKPEHTVTLWVNAVCQAGSLDGDVACVPMVGYQNPCGQQGCEVTTTCIEDRDVPVRFDFTIMAAAKQGFFDIGVRFDEVFCSAKLDTCYENNKPIELLFDDTGGEVRTAVAAIACTAGTEAVTTHLYETKFTARCNGKSYALDLNGLALEGNTELAEVGGVGSLSAAVYFGTEALVNGGSGSQVSANKVFTNIAFVLPPAGCDVSWVVVPTDDGTACPSSLDGSQGFYRQVAGVKFDGTVRGGDVCDRHELDGKDSAVLTAYLDGGMEAYTSRLSEGAQSFVAANCNGDARCADGDGDGFGVGCSAGDDRCDSDPNNWTETGCSSCEDNDGDGFGSSCDKGPDCNDANPSLQADCLLFTLTVADPFGVAHPPQVLDFDAPIRLDPMRRYRTLDSAGDEVVSQVLSGNRIAVRLQGGLAAHGEASWSVHDQPAAPAPATDEVGVVEDERVMEVTNSVTGIRVAKPIALDPNPFGADGALDTGGTPVPAPIQGILLADGQWTAEGFNEVGANDPGTGNIRRLPATSMELEVVDRGPLVTTVRLRYGLSRPESWVNAVYPTHIDASTDILTSTGSHYIENGEADSRWTRCKTYAANVVAPIVAGALYYLDPVDSERFRMLDGPSGTPLDFTANADVGFVCHMSMPPGPGEYVSTITLKAGQSSFLVTDDTDYQIQYGLDLRAGVEPDKARYVGSESSSLACGHGPNGAPYEREHIRGDLQEAEIDLPQDPTACGYGYLYLSPWAAYARDSGWQWQFFRQNAPPQANRIGLFAGPGSEDHHAVRAPLRISPWPAESDLSIRYQTWYRTPDASVSRRHRTTWGFFAGSRGALNAQDEFSDVGREANLQSGIGLRKFTRWVLDYPDPPAGTPGLWMARDRLGQLFENLRADPTGAGADFLGRVEPIDDYYSPGLWDAVTDASGDAARQMADEVVAEVADALESYVHETGVYYANFDWGYWKGGLAMSSALARINTLLVLDEVFSGTLPPESRHRLKAAQSFYAQLLWDNDFVPLDRAGTNLGTPNMAVQHAGSRAMYALSLPTHPSMAGYAEGVRESAIADLEASTNPSGAHMASSHYILPSAIPNTNTFLQLAATGAYDGFDDNPRLAAFARYYLQLHTPPLSAFNGKRRVVNFGDAFSEGTELTGDLGTGFAASNPQLSAELMWMWRAAGMTHDGFFGPSSMKIDESLPATPPALGDELFPGGAVSVLRSGFNTDDESVGWLMTGGFYFDHANCDISAPILYALGAPVSVLWGSIYYPRMEGAWMRNQVLSEAGLSPAWTSDQISPHACLDATSPIGDEALTSTPAAGRLDATFTHGGSDLQHRALTLYRDDPSNPVFRLRDDFSGPWAFEPKVWSLNLTAEGEVVLPNGQSLEPAPGTYDKPSTGPVFVVPQGVARFRFAGQYEIDWDLFVVSNVDQEAYLGRWSYSTMSPEDQFILRLRGDGPFDVVIVPYRKGERPPDLAVTVIGGLLHVTRHGATAPLVDP